MRLSDTSRYLFISFLLFVCTTAATDEAGETEIVVTDQLCSGLFMIPLEWTAKDGKRHELLALFDTGASSSFIDPDSIERISGKRLEPGTRAVMEDVTVAGLDFTSFRPRVRELDHIGQALGQRFDVFLQFQTFDNYLLVLDYASGQMRLKRGSLPEPDDKTVFSAKGRDSRPWHRMRIGSRYRKVLIDSGSNGTFSLRQHRSLRWAGPSEQLRLTQGMSDLELHEVGRFDGSMQVGPLRFEEPIVGITTDTELMGYEVLKHFVLTFDQVNRRVEFAPISEGPIRLESRIGTGALMRPRLNSLEVARIVPGSPAEAVGFLIGDQVTHIDGVPVSERGCSGDRNMTGSQVYLVEREDESLEISVEREVLLE